MAGRRNRGWVRGTGIAVAMLAVLAGGAYVASGLLAPQVSLARPVRAHVVSAFYSTGAVAPPREYPIRAQVTGIVRELPVDKGSAVLPGQVLAVVDDPRLALAVAAAEAQLREADALADPLHSPALAEFDTQLLANTELLAIANREYKRLADMRDANASTNVDLDRAMDRVKILSAERGALTSRRATTLLNMRRQLEVAQATLSSARAQAEKQTVRSPVAGVVLDRPTPLGTHVDAAMSNHLMTLADIRQESLVIRAQVDEEDIAKVRPGQLVRMTLYAFGTDVLTGRVVRVSDQADPERRTFETDVRVEAGARHLSPGMTGELAFVIEAREAAITVPAQAVQVRTRARRAGEARQSSEVTSAAAAEGADEIRETVVWVHRDGRIEGRVVEVGLRSLERVEIVSGLETSDEIVVSAVSPRTADGSRVRSRRMAAATPVTNPATSPSADVKP
jgi:HlyD family secretion protein